MNKLLIIGILQSILLLLIIYIPKYNSTFLIKSFPIITMIILGSSLGIFKAWINESTTKGVNIR